MQTLLMLAQSTTEQTLDTTGLGNLSPPIQIALFLGAMSLATAALVSMTAFTRIVIVLSFARRALATPEIPPNQVLMGLAIFLTFFVMSPTLDTIYREGVKPYLDAQKVDDSALQEIALNNLQKVAQREIKTFMAMHTMEDELELFHAMADVELPEETTDPDAVLRYHVDSLPLKILIPAFVISELKTAFIMGFCIYIPFLLIDLVVSTILMSLGMMMMSPPVVSTPCKLLLFVLVDGWQLISEALVSSFGGS